MIRLIIISCTLFLTTSCANTPSAWHSDNRADQMSIVMESSLWLDKMPNSGGEFGNTYHGSLILDSQRDLPANLMIESLAVKQNGQTWLIDGGMLDINVLSLNRWEVTFTWQLPITAEKPANVALMINYQGHKEWLVDKKVPIDIIN